MNQETRALIEILRDETQSRSVYDRCNEVLAAWSDLDLRAKINAAHPGFWVGEFKPEDVKIEGTVVVRNTDEWLRGVSTITATEAEVEIIMGERRNGDQ